MNQTQESVVSELSENASAIAVPITTAKRKRRSSRSNPSISIVVDPNGDPKILGDRSSLNT